MKPSLVLFVLCWAVGVGARDEFDYNFRGNRPDRSSFSPSNPMDRRIALMNARLAYMQPRLNIPTTPLVVPKPVDLPKVQPKIVIDTPDVAPVKIDTPVIAPVRIESPKIKPVEVQRPTVKIVNAVMNVAVGMVKTLVAAIQAPVRMMQNWAANMAGKVDKVVQGAIKVERLGLGGLISVASGDAFDRPGTIKFDPHGPAVISINGIWNGNKKATEIQNLTQAAFGVQAGVQIKNQTHVRIGDIVQVIGHELGAIDKPAIHTAKAIRAGIEQKGTVYVVGHSQGSAVFRQALSLLSKEDRSKVHYLGVGSQWNIDAKTHGLASAKNVHNKRDIVPKALNYFMAPIHMLIPSRAERVLAPAMSHRPDGSGSAHYFPNYGSAVRDWAREQGFGR